MTEIKLNKLDRDGYEIVLGDILLHLNESDLTKRGYWYPIYKVVWDSPCFRLEYIGGGKSSDTCFTFKHYPEEFLIVGKSRDS